MKNLKLILPIILCITFTHAEESRQEDRHEASIIKAPLQNELTEVYHASEKIGEKAGNKTQNFFCSELHWTFFCKGDN